MDLAKFGVEIDPTEAQKGARDVKRAFDEVERSAEKADKAIDRSERGLRKFGAESVRQAGRIKQATTAYEASFRRLQTAVGGLSVLFAGLGASLFIGGQIKRANDFEDALVAVGKTADLEGQALENFGRQIEKMSTDTLPIAAKELLNTAAAAAQLGVKGEDNLKKFVDVMARLESATSGTVAGEEGGKDIARILNITHENIDTVDQFGASLVALGNSAKANEGEILHMATGVAQATSQFKLSSPEVLGLSTAMVEVGLQAELAGSAIGRTIRTLRNSADTQRDAVATLLGVKPGDVSKAFDAAPVETFLKVLDGLKAAGNDASLVMEAMGLEGDELNKVLPTLANGVEGVREQLERAEKEYRANTALLAESDRAFATNSKQLQLSWNYFQSLAKTVGDFSVSVLVPLVKFLEGVTRAFMDQQKEGDKMNGTYAAIAGALKVVLPLLGAMIALAVAGWLINVAKAALLVATNFVKLRVAMIATPWGAAVTGIALAAGALILVAQNSETARGAIEELKAAWADMSAGEFAEAMVLSLSLGFQDIINDFLRLWAGVGDFVTATLKAAGEVFLELMGASTKPEFWAGIGHALIGHALAFGAKLQEVIAPVIATLQAGINTAVAKAQNAAFVIGLTKAAPTTSTDYDLNFRESTLSLQTGIDKTRALAEEHLAKATAGFESTIPDLGEKVGNVFTAGAKAFEDRLIGAGSKWEALDTTITRNELQALTDRTYGSARDKTAKATAEAEAATQEASNQTVKQVEDMSNRIKKILGATGEGTGKTGGGGGGGGGGSSRTDAATKDLEKISRETSDFYSDMKAQDASYTDAFMRGVRERAESWGTGMEMMADMGGNIADSLGGSLGGAITDFAYRTKSAEEAFGEMADAIIQDIAQMTIKMLVQLAIQQALGGIGGGFGSGVAASGWAANATAVVAHGGLNPADHDPPARQVPATLFTHAPRYHGGGNVGDDEQAAVLKRGEAVLTPDQKAASLKESMPGQREQSRQPVQVQILNVDDPRKITEHINSNPDLIVNALNKRLPMVRRMVQGRANPK